MALAGGARGSNPTTGSTPLPETAAAGRAEPFTGGGDRVITAMISDEQQAVRRTVSDRPKPAIRLPPRIAQASNSAVKGILRVFFHFLLEVGPTDWSVFVGLHMPLLL